MMAPKWSALRPIGSSPPAKLSTVMPFLGYLIIFQQDIVHAASKVYFSYHQLDRITPSGQIDTNLYFIYFGLFIFGVGSFIFFIACDPIIKRHVDSEAFCSYSAAASVTSDIIAYCDYIQSAKGSSDTERTQATLIASSTLSGVQPTLTQESKFFVYKTVYRIKDENFTALRWATFLAFGCGLALLAIPSVVVFLKVCRVFFSQLF
ncbi:hypothetical protein K9U39_10490 [Rhodoblastus acidophilus]|uniref:Uncharacterized protein n=1 Tax=Candidatus Rhodoblastus alkanivorans TaxID=2954117 RepID=A0ABS9Z8W7_9HYPH|nr:hypothetical protein [Candidatus Rhodoblastus alkanivorans]MCI4679332.1 hypothetical protein [Candidatus Rhodoblastus alkanivorans]MCI4684041.1 hypothetical protein [Candidatus Rhodoblastus alkanivorans]MDI4641360.1 hypothetical protein [Rhodoblastus acidophilus]